MKKIVEKLNNEYGNIGTISVEDMSTESLEPRQIEYVQSIMDNVTPLDSDEPIVVGLEYGDFKLIDGYHRLKSRILAKTSINAIILKRYRIYRKSDNLFGFMSSLVGKTIKFLENNTFELDGKLYYIKENEGCGGCGNGWSSFKLLPKFINRKINIKTVTSKDSEYDKYELFINGKLFANVDTGWGNGYYGGDFEIVH